MKFVYKRNLKKKQKFIMVHLVYENYKNSWCNVIWNLVENLKSNNLDDFIYDDALPIGIAYKCCKVCGKAYKLQDPSYYQKLKRYHDSIKKEKRENNKTNI